MKLVPSRLGSRVVGIAAAAACAAAMTAIVTPSASSAASLVAAPKVGQCRNYTLQQSAKASNNSPVVSCKTKHTAKVIGVFQLPAATPWTQAKVVPFAIEKCYPKFRTTLGRTERLRHLSAYNFAFFIPTQQQRENGARWVRCDIVLFGASMLRPLPSNTTPMLPKAPLPNKVARCLTATHVATTCAQRHTFRATGAFAVANKRFPGDQTMTAIARRRCPALVSNPRAWYATWASKTAYNLGRDRMIVCHSRRSN